MPHYSILLKSFLILSSCWCPGLPSGLLSSGFPTKTLYAFLFFLMHSTSPTYFNFLDLFILIIFHIYHLTEILGILANNQLDALFHVFIYFISQHVSSITVLIIRRSNCINTSSGMISLCQ